MKNVIQQFVTVSPVTDGEKAKINPYLLEIKIQSSKNDIMQNFVIFKI